MSALDNAQSAVATAGSHAASIDRLFHVFLAVSALMFALVMIFLVAAIARRRGARQDGLPDPDGVSTEPAMHRTLLGWTGLIAAGLVGLTLASYFTDRALAGIAPGRVAGGVEPLQVRVIAKQWWWQVEYEDAQPSRRVSTANELVLPVGRPVRLRLESPDVIHSFWVPSLAGKQDLIPGRKNDIELLPTQAGRFRGECAEFCGLQHANMAFDVHVVPPAEFEAWYAHQLEPAPQPQDPLQQAGQDYFMGYQCANCHQIAGTEANGRLGPTLTHFASRATIAAGTLPNGTAQLHAWLADPQHVKPGNRMPYIPLEPGQVQALAAYLETLR